MSVWFDAMQEFADTHDGCRVDGESVIVPIELQDSCKAHVEAAIENVRKGWG